MCTIYNWMNFNEIFNQRSTNSIKMKTIKVHRLVMMSFYPLSDVLLYDNKVINHIDGNKSNNNVNNLEWLSILNNTRHAWNCGLNNNFGENHFNSKYSNFIIEEFCRMIDLGYSNPDICNINNIHDIKERMRLSATLSSIRYGKTHLDISSKYNFMKNNLTFKSNEELINDICIILSDENFYTFDEIMTLLSIPYSEKLQFINFIHNLINKRTAVEISKKYNNLKMPIK